MEMKKRKNRILLKPTTRTNLLFVVLFTTIFLLVSYVFGIINARSDSGLKFNTENGCYDFEENNVAANDSSFIGENWIFAPNISVTDFIESDHNYYLYSNGPYASGVSISGSGWDNLGSNAEWHNSHTERSKTLRSYEFQNHSYNSGAYFMKFHLPTDLSTINISIPFISGEAYIYCNGSFVGSLGEADYDANISFDVSCGYSSLSLPSDENNNVELVIIVISDTLMPYQGITSIPAIEGNSADADAIAISSSWLVIVVSLTVFSVLGGWIISKTFHNIRKYYFFAASNIVFVLYFLCDNNYLVMNALTRSVTCFSLFILLIVLFYDFISALFIDAEQNKVMLFLRCDNKIVACMGIALVALVLLDISLVDSNYLNIVSKIFAITLLGICVIKVFFIYSDSRHSTIGLCSAVTGVFLFSYMMIEDSRIINISIYSIFYIIAISAIELVFVYNYLQQFREVRESENHLQYVVKKKTQHISEINVDLYNTNKKLIQNEEARKNVMSNVSHDLRTPIAAIRGYAELMLGAKDTMSDEQKTMYLQNIIRRSQQMERIVSDIVELSRMESSGNEFNFMDCSVSELLDEIYSLFYADLRNTDKKFTINLPEDDLLIVKADPKKLSRVFENLISNAINYTNDSAKIEIKAWRTGQELAIEDQRVHVTVSDNGIGIPAEEIPLIFDRFYRAKNSGKNIKGTGLGLSIVKLIVDKHDAEISIESKLDYGTTFHIIMKAIP